MMRGAGGVRKSKGMSGKIILLVLPICALERLINLIIFIILALSHILSTLLRFSLGNSVGVFFLST